MLAFRPLLMSSLLVLLTSSALVDARAHKPFRRADPSVQSNQSNIASASHASSASASGGSAAAQPTGSPVVIYTEHGPGIHDLNGNTTSQVKNKEIKAILYALSKCTRGRWIMDLMGQRIETTEGVVPAYSNSTVSYSFFTSRFHRTEINVALSGQGAQWAVGYEAAFEKVKDDPEMLPAGGSWNLEEALRSISGYPTRRFLPSELGDEAGLMKFLKRVDETPVLAVGNATGGSSVLTPGIWVVSHADEKTKQFGMFHADDGQYLDNVPLAVLGKQIEYYVTLADFQRWTPSLFPWH